jgi:AcrR family transcriptional regulator
VSPTTDRGAPAKRRGRPVAGTGEATRRRVLDAARQEFAERGYAAATMRSIASAAGVTPMSLYNYARSKAALFSAVWDDSLEQIYRDYDATLVGRGSLVEELDAVIDRSRGLLLEAPEHVRLVLRILLDRTHPELAGADLQPPSAVEFYTRLVERGVSRGDIAPDDRGHLITWLVTLQWGMTTVAAFDAASLDFVSETAKWAVRAQLQRPRKREADCRQRSWEREPGRRSGGAPSSGREPAGGVREALISAAEQLIAERGLDAVSLREIIAAARATNASAIHYHFGGRDGLIRALLEKRQPHIDQRRHEMLDAYEARTEKDLRSLAAALVEPLAAELTEEGGQGYLQLVSDLLNRPDVTFDAEALGDPTSSLVRWHALALPMMSPEAAQLHRRFNSLRFAVSELARRARTRRRDHRLFTSQLTDLVLAMLIAPVSEETGRLMRR